MEDRRYLRIYLGDHLAVIRGGRSLVSRMQGGDRGEVAGLLEEAARELDRGDALVSAFLRQIGASRPWLKVGAATLAERAGRLKLNGRLLRPSPLSPLVELEGLAACLAATAAMYRALAAADVASPELVEARGEACTRLAEEAGRHGLGAARRALESGVETLSQ
ncbi:MAG TPA: hypothetical protein VNT51_09490 [Miltoncostaeaceae bacterium]|nr:hypothetical protein [Miltoncostaeaceae bacterium]